MALNYAYGHRDKSRRSSNDSRKNVETTRVYSVPLKIFVDTLQSGTGHSRVSWLCRADCSSDLHASSAELSVLATSRRSRFRNQL